MSHNNLYFLIEGLISLSNLEEAIKVSCEYLPSQDLILISSRFFKLKKDYNRGIISNEDHKVEYNKIALSLLDTIKLIDQNPKSKKNKLKKWRNRLIWFIMSWFLDYHKLLLSIKTILIGIIIFCASLYLFIEKFTKESIKSSETVSFENEDPPSNIVRDSISSASELSQTPKTENEPSKLKQSTSLDMEQDKKEEYIVGPKNIKIETDTNLDLPVEGRTYNGWSTELAKGSLKNNIEQKIMWYSENLKEADYYSWEAAKIICPKDWHLPSIDEWQSLLNNNGGFILNIRDKRSGKGEKTYDNLIKNGIKIKLYGSFKDNQIVGNESDGFYWTSTENNESKAFAIKFIMEDADIVRTYQTSINKTVGALCVCKKD